MRADTPGYVRALAKELRKRQTPAEKILWECLRRNQVSGCRFYRQYPINRFIVDFFCPARKLAIEVDGPIHETERKQAVDQEKEAYLRGKGFYILRFTNNQAMSETDAVLCKINQILSLLRNDVKIV